MKTLSAANRVACHGVYSHGSSSPRTPSLRAALAECGPGLGSDFSDQSTEDQSFVWRIPVEPDPIRQLLHELGIAAEFEGPGPMRLEPMGLPDPVHGFQAHTDHGSQGASRPVRGRQRQGGRGEGHNALDRDRPEAMSAAFGSILAARRLHARLQMVSFAAPQKPSRQGRCR